MTEPICPACYIEDIALQRYALGYRTCLTCGEKQAKKVRHTVAPMLKGLNSSHKGGLS